MSNRPSTLAAHDPGLRWTHAVNRLAGCADSPWFFPIVLVATVAGLFCDALGPDCVFAYRDSLHFYPQLYQLVREEWLAGRVPLWNPYLNCGQPLAGCGTSGAFYPPQILLTMLLPDGVSLNVYGILHLAWAATGAYLLARYQKCPRPAATVAGLAYGFCGSVLLQIYNPTYAAGAAWLVWAVYAGIRMLDGGGLRDILILAAALAMCVFCGEPQAAYHAGLVLGLFWLLMPGRSWRQGVMLAAGGIAGGVLALVQIVLAAEFSGQTTRAMERAPYSLWQVPRFLARSPADREGAQWYDIFIGRPPANSVHYDSLYDFSLSPVRLLELIWPDFSGPTCYRWLSLLRLDDSGAWANSLYAGIVPAVAALAALIVVRRRSATARYWTVLLVLALLASFGGLGPVGLVRKLWAAFNGHWSALGYRPGDEVGGLSWLVSISLPGYEGFRYPSKWMTVFALAFAQLAALALSSAAQRGIVAWLLRTAQMVGVTLAVAVVGLMLAAAVWGADSVLPGAVGDDRRPYALWVVTIGGVQAAVVAAIAGGIVVRLAHACGPERPAWMAVLAVVTAIDLVVAGRREIVVGPYRTLVDSSRYVADLAAARREDLARVSGGLRVAIQSKLPRRVDERDPCEVVRATGLMLRSHVPWAHHCGIFGQSSTAMQIDVDTLSRPLQTPGGSVPPRRGFDLAGVEYFILSLEGMNRGRVAKTFSDWSSDQRQGVFIGPAPSGPPLPTAEISPPGGGPPAVLAVRNESALPRARIVRRLLAVEPVASGDCRARERLLTTVAFPSLDVPELFTTAIIERPPGTTLPAYEAGPPSLAAADECRIIHDDPQRVVVEARLEAPGMLILADTFSDDWQATLRTDGGVPRAVPTLRANHIHRAVPLPAGASTLEFRYASRAFRWSAAITLAAWGMWVLVVGRYALRLRRTTDVVDSRHAD